jgi:hypothetical protein
MAKKKTEETETLIWEGSVDKGRWTVRVFGIPNNPVRGTLKIFNSADEVKYQREVSVDQAGPTNYSKTVAEWQKIILNWVDNQS